MEVTTYTSRAHREGAWWIVQCDEVPGAMSQVKRLNEAAEAQREAIAWVAEVPAESVEVRIVAAITPEVDREIEQLRGIRAEADEREARAGEISRALAHQLKAEGFTVREIGVILGISFQRVDQLTKHAPANVELNVS